MKTLLFEGAGMEIYEQGSDAVSYRIRTRLKNIDGRIIYLEFTGHKSTKYDKINSVFPAFILHCFYEDREQDKRNNYSKELNFSRAGRFEYTKENILKFVNENLNCDFDEMKVELDGVRVFDTEKEIC